MVSYGNYIYILAHWLNGLCVHHWSGRPGFNPRLSHTKDFKRLDTSLLNTQQYKYILRVKWSNPGKGVAPLPTTQCSSYWTGSLQVAFKNGQQLYLVIYIYIYISSSYRAGSISLTLSRHSSLSFIALGRSSGQQPVSSHSCWMYVRAGRPAFARPLCGDP